MSRRSRQREAEMDRLALEANTRSVNRQFLNRHCTGKTIVSKRSAKTQGKGMRKVLRESQYGKPFRDGHISMRTWVKKLF